MGIIYLAYFLYLVNTPFITITKKEITRYRLIKNETLKLNELRELVLDRSGNYYLINKKNKTIIVKPSSIDSKSLDSFKIFIQELNLDKKE